MINEPPLLEIAQTKGRPEPELLGMFKGVPTSFIVDAMGGRGAVDWRIKPIGPVRPFAGTALTCHCGPADNLALCAAVAECVAGDVLVAATDQYTGCSVVGDLLLGIARNRGAEAFVTDGLVRDAGDIENLAIPCFAMGVSPNSPARNGPGSVGMPVQCGGVQVDTGDVMVGDRDGVVVVPKGRINEVLSCLETVKAAEARMLSKVKGGLTDVEFVATLLASDRIRRIDR